MRSHHQSVHKKTGPVARIESFELNIHAFMHGDEENDEKSDDDADDGADPASDPSKPKPPKGKKAAEIDPQDG